MLEGILVGLVVLNSLGLLVLLGRRRPTPPPPPKPQPSQPQLSPQVQAELQRKAAETFEAAIQVATTKFGQDLAATSERLNSLIVKLTTDIVEHQLSGYKQGIETARAQAIETLGKLQTETLARQKELQRDLEAEITARRAQLLERIDQRLGEAAVAYIVESLGQGADVGAQRTWILDSLERHKADLKKDLADEA